MRFPSLVLAIVVGVSLLVPLHAEAQTRQRQVLRQNNGGALVLRVQPRSFLDPGPVVPVGSLNRGTSGYAQTQAYLLSPDYSPTRAQFGLYLLSDPITNGPFVGSRNPFGPVDFVAPRGLAP